MTVVAVAVAVAVAVEFYDIVVAVVSVCPSRLARAAMPRANGPFKVGI